VQFKLILDITYCVCIALFRSAAQIGRQLAYIGDTINERHSAHFSQMIRLMNITPETAYEAFAGIARKYAFSQLILLCIGLQKTRVFIKKPNLVVFGFWAFFWGGFIGWTGFCKGRSLIGFGICAGFQLVDSYGCLFAPQGIKYSIICKFVGLNVLET